VSVDWKPKIADRQDIGRLEATGISQRKRDEMLSLGSIFTSATSLRWSAPMNFAGKWFDREHNLDGLSAFDDVIVW